ncbi:MAG: flagellar basal-body MS-ring/collar protein FliF [Terracidiphilus sp.]
MATTPSHLEKVVPVPLAAGPWSAGLVPLWTRARVRWAALSRSQRRSFTVAASLLALLLGGMLWNGLRTDWRTLYAGLDPEDARQTGLTLTQAQITFEVGDHGTAILVPAPELDKARLATAAKGGVKTGRLGFELFDKPNWVGSEFDEQVNYQRALEGELEHTAGTLADVESARVHLVLPHESLFRDQERPAKASVVLKLRHASLADGEADSIRNLVASAVDGLSADRVVLVDAAGHLPLGPKTPEGLRLGAEQTLEEKLIATLEPVTGPGNVRASITLDYDDAATEETEETYDPDQTATLAMQRTEETSGAQPVAAGVPGTASNAPNTQSLPVYPRQTSPPETSKSESGTYGVSKSVRHVQQSPGRVRRMTAAIVVNDRLLHAASKNAFAQWQPWSADQLHNLTLLAQASVGFDPVRGDVLTIEDLAFDENRAQPPPSLPTRLLRATEDFPLLTKYVALLSGLLLVVTFGVRPALQLARTLPPGLGKAKGATAEVHAGASPQPALGPAEPPPLDPDRQRSQEIFEQVTDHLKREPTQSSRLLQSWIHSD